MPITPLLCVVLFALIGCVGNAAKFKRVTIETERIDTSILSKSNNQITGGGHASAQGVSVGNGVFMIPMGLDDVQCERFNPFSAKRPTKRAIHYRQADGRFDILRDPAVCKVNMVALGRDANGCETFRALPVNKNLPAIDIVYYLHADGRYLASDSSCSNN